jgi:hypothetical protein
MRTWRCALSAFYVYQGGAAQDVVGATSVMTRKGFGEPRHTRCGDWNVLHWRKQLVPSAPVDVSGDCGDHLFAFGAPVVEGEDWPTGIKRLLDACRTDTVTKTRVRGSYFLLYWTGTNWRLYFDAAGTYHVFASVDSRVLSSSFLAVLAGSPRPLPLNRIAVAEKLATGYLTPPHTLVDGIIQLPSAFGLGQGRHSDLEVRWLPGSSGPSTTEPKRRRDSSVADQARAVREHLAAITPMAAGLRADLGLSSGFDSRLILAARGDLGASMQLHSHATRGVHDRELSLVRQLAEYTKLPLRAVETRDLAALDGDALEATVLDGLYFYDARFSHNMGILSEVYTRGYRARVHEGAGFALNGLGGEVLRNYYATPPFGVCLRPWMDRHVYYPFARTAIGNDSLLDVVHERKVAHLESRVGAVGRGGFVSRRWLRTYYSCVRMPDGDATNGDALSQLVFYHMPFMEPHVVEQALQAEPHIGVAGSFQGSVIEAIDPGLAAMQSHYGHVLNVVPGRVRLKEGVRYVTPHAVQAQYVRRKLRQFEHARVSEFDSLSERAPLLKRFKEVLQDCVLRGRFEDGLLHYAQRPTMLGVGAFLLEFQSKLDLGGP